jgi:hypothetical protein
MKGRSRAALVAAALLVTGMVGTGQAQAASQTTTFHMGDGGGTMVAESGGTQGTLKNVTTGQPGAVGKGYLFAKKPAYVAVSSTSALNPGTSSFSVSIRAKFPKRPSSSVADFDLVRKGLQSNSGGDYKIEILRDGRAFCLYQGSSGIVSVTGSKNLADNAWHKITCKRSSSKVTLTVDGQSKSTSRPTGKISNSAKLYVGAKDGSGDDQYSGYLDELVIKKG